MAAGVVPQSSCSFSPIAPALTCASSAAGWLALPLPRKPRFIGNASAACSIRCRFHGPGVQVVALVPVAGPVPPPSMVVTPDIRASSICCGQMKWMCASIPPAVRIWPSPAMASVPGPITMSTPGCVSGLPALPIPLIRPSVIPMSALTTPQWSRISALVMTRSTASPGPRWLWPMPSRMTLPPPNLTSSPYRVWSDSTSIQSSVSARRTRSPTVGPYISA